MRERPELSDATILEALRVQYGMPGAAVTFFDLPAPGSIISFALGSDYPGQS